jgi:hypothetical protein
MHDDFDKEISTFYSIHMETFKAQPLSETPFSLDRFWEKPELLKEAATFSTKEGFCTVVEQARRSDSYYERVNLESPAPIQRERLAGPMTYLFFAGEQIYMAEMEGNMGISRLDPLTGERRVLAKQTRCFTKDEFGHIVGDRPQVVGDWLYYRDADTGEILCVEIEG